MKTKLQRKKILLLGLVLLLYALVLLPLLIINLQKQQHLNSKAAEQTTGIPPVCANSPADIMIAIDRSSSMKGSKIDQAKTAAKNFIDILALNADNRVGLVTFANNGSGTTLDFPLTNNFASLKTAIDNITLSDGTCIECAINKANQELQTHNRAGYKPAIVLLTDGGPTATESLPWPKATGSQSIDAAGNAATNVANTTKAVIYTIGLGTDVNQTLLQQIAEKTGGKYYFPPTPDHLQEIYTNISELVGKGSVTGFVFNDANGNSVFDTTEQKLSGWTIQMFAQGSSTPQTFTSDNLGTFHIPDLCDGTYQMKEVVQSGWRQTLPGDANGYLITINKASVLKDKNFGNDVAPTATPTPLPRCADTIDNDTNGFIDTKDSTCHTDGNPTNPNSYDPNKDGEHGGNTCADSKDNNGNNLIDGADPICHTGGNPNNPWDPNLPELAPTPTFTPTPTPTNTPTPTKVPTPTLTPTPAATSFNLTVFQHGIGNSGDNTNAASSLSNKNPQHKQVAAEILMYDVNNALIAKGTGQLSYNIQNGNYTGSIGITPNNFPTGKYTLNVRTDQHLRKFLNGIQTIQAGSQNNSLTPVTVVAGDANNDNRLDITDYNLLLDCYSDLVAAAVACSNPQKKIVTDFNDDNAVNQFDYNLFLRELATQPGE